MKREMTDEIRRKLSGLLPFAPGSSLPYTPEAFQKVEDAYRPLFRLCRFPTPVQREVEQKLLGKELNRDSMVKALQDGGCLGWENLLDLGTGIALGFNKEAIDLLPDPTILALFWKCMNLTGLTEEEKEGLDSSPQHTSEPSSRTAESADVTQA
jgi:hypothetical protein